MKKKILIVIIVLLLVTGTYFGLHKKVQNQTNNQQLPIVTTSTTTSVGTISVQKQTPIGVLTGHFTVSPTCPVEKTPPDPACAPKPYAALINIVSSSGEITQVHADMTGKFYVPLPVGTYTIMDASSVIYPRCDSKKATVTENKVTIADVSCDSGIR